MKYVWIFVVLCATAFGQNSYGPDFLNLHCTAPDPNSNVLFNIPPRPGLVPNASPNGNVILYCDASSGALKASFSGGAYAAFGGSGTVTSGTSGTLAGYPSTGTSVATAGTSTSGPWFGSDTFSSVTYPSMGVGNKSGTPNGALICGVTAAGNYPPSPNNGYGYAGIDVCPALFTAPPPLVAGTSSRSIMGINSAISTQFPDSQNVFSINGEITTPSTSSTNQFTWYNVYGENDWNGSGTLTNSYGGFFTAYNSIGTGTITNNIGLHAEASNGLGAGTNTITNNRAFEVFGYNGTISTSTTTITNNTAATFTSGAKSGTVTNDGTVLIASPQTGGTITNQRFGLKIADQTAAGTFPTALALQIGNGGTATSGKIDLGANPVSLETSGGGSVNFLIPTGSANVSEVWPTAWQGTLLSGGRTFLSADFTSANSASLQNIAGLNYVTQATGNSTFAFHCSLAYSQATNVAGDQFGIGANGNPTNAHVSASVATNSGATTPFTTADSGNLTTLTTPVAVVTFQPGGTGTFMATLDGMVEGLTSSTTFQLSVLNGTAADVIVVHRGSYCVFY